MLNFPVQLFAQIERQALQSIQKCKWSKARSQLDRAAGNDSLTVASSFAWGNYFSARSNPDFHLDSANYHAHRALHKFEQSTKKQRERFKRFPIDSLILKTLIVHIDSMAFHNAVTSNQLSDYQNFLKAYPKSRQWSVAVALRDSAAFSEAWAIGSQQSLRRFLNDYPEALHVPETRQRYDQLLFDSLTLDKRMISYQDYLKEHPNATFSREAARNIFEIQTASGTVESFRDYINRGDVGFNRRATNILFYLLPQEQIDRDLLTLFPDDSLKSAIGLQGSYLAPVLHNGRFGFIDPLGTEIIATESENIEEEFLCGNIAEDVLLLNGKVVARSGAVIINHSVDAIDDIGYGFLVLSTDTCAQLIHKTGFQVGPNCIEQARVLNGKFLALHVNGKWAVYTFTGRMLLPFDFDDVTSISNVILLRLEQGVRLITENTLASLAENREAFSASLNVDDVVEWTNKRLWIRQGNVQRVLTLALDTLITAGDQNIAPASAGIILSDFSGSQMINRSGQQSPVFLQIKSNKFWTSVERSEGWYLFDPIANARTSPAYDTVTFYGPVAIGSISDSLHVHFSPTSVLKLKQPARTVAVGMDSVFYLLVEEQKRKHLYDQRGERLFSVSYDRIQYIGHGYFTVHRKDKIGLVNSKGKLVVPVEMDAIGSIREGLASLLQKAKFGSFNCINGQVISPRYEKNLIAYNDKLVVVLTNSFYKLVDWKNDLISKAGYDEIRYWNDTAAFVRKDFQWMICEIKSGNILMEGMRHFKLIRDKPGDRLAIVNAGHNFGVIHNQKGTIIPISFSDIINVGSARQPLYFAEKRVEEADLFVVLYYDSSGKMVRKEVYDHNDYERIYCPNN